MKKALLLLLVSTVLLLTFTSCTRLFADKLPGVKEPPHSHVFSEEWTSEGSIHYHGCECGAQSDSAVHKDTDLDGICEICLAELPEEDLCHTVTVKATKDGEQPFFGNTVLVKHGTNTAFDIIVGVEYTVELNYGKIVGEETRDTERIYTIEVENVLEDIEILVRCIPVANDSVQATPSA